MLKHPRLKTLTFLTTLVLIAATKTDAQAPFGINSDDPAATEAYLRIPDAGFGSIRLMANWRNLEPQQGTILWAGLDARVAEAEKLGLDILLSFYFIPTWANNTLPTCGLFVESCSLPPTNPSYFPSFVTQVVNRYKGRIHYYGIWNEPDYEPFWGGTNQEFLDLILRPGIQAVRAADPTAKTVGPDIYAESSFLQTVLNEFCNDPNPANNLDVIAVHIYPSPTTTSTSAEVMLATTDAYLQQMSQAGCEQPLWITEYGVNTFSPDPSEQAAFEVTQGEEYVQALAGILARSAVASNPKAERLFLFRLQDNEPEQPYRSGLLRSESEGYTKKPSFYAVESFLRSVFETRIVTIDEEVPGIFALTGTGSTSYFPANTITTLPWGFEGCGPGLPCAAVDNKWNAENDAIVGGLPGFNFLTSHTLFENAPGLIISVTGLADGAPYDAELRYGTVLTSPGPGIFAGMGESGPLTLYNNQTPNHVERRSMAEWREWEVALGQGVVSNSKLSIKIDDSPLVDNAVFSGLRLSSPLIPSGGLIFADGFETGTCSSWTDAEPACP